MKYTIEQIIAFLAEYEQWPKEAIHRFVMDLETYTNLDHREELAKICFSERIKTGQARPVPSEE